MALQNVWFSAFSTISYELRPVELPKNKNIERGCPIAGNVNAVQLGFKIKILFFFKSFDSPSLLSSHVFPSLHVDVGLERQVFIEYACETSFWENIKRCEPERRLLSWKWRFESSWNKGRWLILKLRKGKMDFAVLVTWWAAGEWGWRWCQGSLTHHWFPVYSPPCRRRRRLNRCALTSFRPHPPSPQHLFYRSPRPPALLSYPPLRLRRRYRRLNGGAWESGDDCVGTVEVKGRALTRELLPFLQHLGRSGRHFLHVLLDRLHLALASVTVHTLLVYL